MKVLVLQREDSCLLSAHNFLELTLPFKLKFASSVHSLRRASRYQHHIMLEIHLQSRYVLWVFKLQHLDALIPVCESTECSSFRIGVLDASNTRSVPLAVCMCPEVTVWCTPVTTSSETISRLDQGLSHVQLVSSNFFNKSRTPCGIHGPCLWRGFRW